MMFREHVLLSLSLLIGMLFIIDLYIAAMYMNKNNDGNIFLQKVNNNPAPRIITTTTFTIPPGRDTEYGFDLRLSPHDAALFKYFYYPYQGHLTIMLPADKLRTINTTEQVVLDYVVKRIMEESSFQQKSIGRYYSGYLGEEVQEGTVWVKEDTLTRISTNPANQLNSLKRKRSLNVVEADLTSLKVLRTTQSKLDKLLHSPIAPKLDVKSSSVSDVIAGWEQLLNVL